MVAVGSTRPQCRC